MLYPFRNITLFSFPFCLSLSIVCYKSQEIIISKTDGERLGMHIKGGLNGQRGNPVDPTDEGVFVSKINSVGAARRDGRLKVSLPLPSQVIYKYH